MMRQAFGMALVWTAAAAPALAQQSAPVDNPGPNAAIQRVTRGEYAYRALKDGRARGSERFELIAHPDDTRTLVMWNDLYARNGQIHGVLRVDGRFRPIETHYTYWTDGKFKGAAYFRLEGATLDGLLRSADGTVGTQRVNVPEAVSFAVHPLAGDGWHAWYVDRERPDEQPGIVVNFDASSDFAAPPSARLQPQSWKYLGREPVTVPAGRFDCDR